jgi:hypothetical protein
MQLETNLYGEFLPVSEIIKFMKKIITQLLFKP